MKFEEVLPQLRAGRFVRWHDKSPIHMTPSQFIYDDNQTQPDWLAAAIGADGWSVLIDPVEVEAQRLLTIWRSCQGISNNWIPILGKGDFSDGFRALARDRLK